jgi:hypothetical protein
MSINYIKAANEIAKLYVAQGNGLIQLSDKLLHALREAESNGTDVNMVWASIARTNNWSDRDAGLDGNPMPKTLANYRSMSRKAIQLSVGHNYSDHATWKKAIAQANKLSKSQEAEETPRIPSVDLNEIELPGWIERATGLRNSMTGENIAAFDKAIHHAIESFMQKKVK